MKQCWDADPSKRPDINTLLKEIAGLFLSYQNMPNKSFQSETNNNLEENFYTGSKIFSTSKIHKFENLPEPRNATEEEQEAFYSRLYDFNIPNNVEDFNKSSDQNNKSSKISSIFKANSKKLSKVFKKLKINSKNYNQNDHKKGTMPQQININEDEVYNNPNLHSEDQDELEIPDGGF